MSCLAAVNLAQLRQQLGVLVRAEEARQPLIAEEFRGHDTVIWLPDGIGELSVSR